MCTKKARSRACAHVRVHRSRGASRNAGRAPRAAREACSATADREPRPPRVARARCGLTAHGCIGLGSANLRSCRLAPLVAGADDAARKTATVDRVGVSLLHEASESARHGSVLGQHCVGATDSTKTSTLPVRMRLTAHNFRPVFFWSIFQDPCPTHNSTRRVTMPQVLTRRSELIHPSSQARSPAPSVLSSPGK